MLFNGPQATPQRALFMLKMTLEPLPTQPE